MVKRLRTARQTGPTASYTVRAALFSFFETLFCTGLMPPSVISIFRLFEDVTEIAGRIRGELMYHIGHLKSAAWPRQGARWAAVFKIWSYLACIWRSAKGS